MTLFATKTNSRGKVKDRQGSIRDFYHDIHNSLKLLKKNSDLFLFDLKLNPKLKLNNCLGYGYKQEKSVT